MSTQPTKPETIVKIVEAGRKQQQPPDGGWGWVVCFATACNNFTVVFLTGSSGIFLIGLKRTFQEPVSKLSLISGMLNGLSMLAAPIASVLLNYFSHRTVLILSSLIGFTGALLGAFSTGLDMMIVAYGLITGVSLGMIYFTSNIITGLYFKKKRVLALGTANCGGSVSIMVSSLIMEYLLDFYGLRGTLLLISGLLLNCIVYGSLCRPLPSTNTDAKNSAYIDVTDHPSAIETPSSAPDSWNRENVNQNEIMNEAFDMSDENQNTDHFSNEDKKDIEDKSKQNVKDKGSILERCSTIIGDELFRNVNFMLLVLCYVLWAFANTMYTYVAPMSTWSFGMSEQRAASLVSLVGLFAMLGHVSVGVFVDLFHLSCKTMYIITLSTISVTVLSMPFCYKFEYLAPVLCVFGITIGFAVSLRLVLTTEIVGPERSTKAYSILSFACGISFLVSPPIFGLVFDITNSFLAVYFAGGACALTSLILFLIIVCRDTFHQKRLKE